MILYRKGASLRVRRAAVPEPPFWAATTVAPYAARRGTPVSIDYLDLRATAAERLEVTVCEDVRDELERATKPWHEPLLIEATERAEAVVGRGEELLAIAEEQRIAATLLVSTRGALPPRAYEGASIAVAAWPLDLALLERLFASAKGRWGVTVPIVYPVTTNRDALEKLADLAKAHGASFLAALPVALDPTAKQALAQSLDDDTYATLFHADLDAVHLAAERHVSALAAARGLADFIVPPRWERKSNWNAAVVLKLAAARMMGMEQDLDLATAIARSAHLVATLDKPIERIAEAASLSIVEGLDPTSVEMLTEWLREGTSGFAEAVDEQWRNDER